MLGSDGPNVARTVWKRVSAKAREEGGNLLETGTCLLHIAHNAFGNGLTIYGANIPNFIIDVYQWFKLSAAR